MWLGEAEDYIAAATAVSTIGATVFSSTCRSRHARSVAPAHLAHHLVDATDGGANARGRVTRCVMPRGRRAIGAAEDRPERLVDGVAEMIAQLLQPIQLRRPYRDLGVARPTRWRAAPRNVSDRPVPPPPCAVLVARCGPADPATATFKMASRVRRAVTRPSMLAPGSKAGLSWISGCGERSPCSSSVSIWV